MNNTNNKIVWTWLRDGKPSGYFKNEHSLLVSYDMMPLRGLDVIKKLLNETGRITRGCFEISPNTNLFIPFCHDNPDIDAVDWGCNDISHDRCLYSLAYYIISNIEIFTISCEDNDLLGEYHLRKYVTDGRRRRPLKGLEAKAEDIINGLGYSIHSVTFVPEA